MPSVAFSSFQIHDPNGVAQSTDWAMSKINEVLQRFKKEHPDFIGGKVIYIIARYPFHMIHCQNPLIQTNVMLSKTDDINFT